MRRDVLSPCRVAWPPTAFVTFLRKLPACLVLVFVVFFLTLLVGVWVKWAWLAVPSYVMVILTGCVICLAAVATSLLCLVNLFPGYWRSGYPPMQAFMIASFGVFRSPHGMQIPIVAVMMFVAGLLIGRACPRLLTCAIPAVTLVAFYLSGELPNKDGMGTLAMTTAGGLVLGPWFGQRQRDGSEGKAGLAGSGRDLGFRNVLPAMAG